MSFSVNSSQQISIFDATANLTQREIKCSKNRGQNTLLENIFPAIDERTIQSSL